MKPRRAHPRSFTLIEAVTVVLVLALAVPPAMNWLDAAVSARADAINATRGTAMATAILEHILADCSSDSTGLGFAALASSNQYLSGNTGLYARLTPVTDLYTPMGFTYSVSIGVLVDKTGVVNADSSKNDFRLVGVTVDLPASTGGKLHLAVSAMVSGGGGS